MLGPHENSQSVEQLLEGRVHESDTGIMSEGEGQPHDERSGRLLGLWWISWFGVIIAFIYVAVTECRRELSVGSPALTFSATAVIGVLGSWAAFFVSEN